MSIELILLTVVGCVIGTIVGTIIGIWLADKIFNWWDRRHPR